MIPFRRYVTLLALAGFVAACKTQQPASQPTATAPSVESKLKGESEKAESKPSYPYRASRTRETDLVHTKLELRFDWNKKHVKGIATLTAKPYFFPQRTLDLDAVGFDIHSVSLLKAKKETPLKYNYDGKQLSIKLDTLYTRDEQYVIEVEYTAKPDEAPLGGSAAITSDKGLYFINPDGADPLKPKQIWTQGETQANSKWFPTIDAPNERMTQEMHLTVDKKYKTLSNGLLTYSTDNADGTRTDVWEMKQPHAPYLAMIAVGEFAVVKDKWNNMEVSYYVEPKFEPHARAIFGRTPEMIEFFSKKLNYKFPWPKYSQVVVRDYVSGAMENTTASVFMEQVQMTDRQLIDQNWDGIVAHELFHQWFGDLVTCESWSNLTLNEGFANYSEYLWKEHKEGVDEADYHNFSELQGYLSEFMQKREPLIRYHWESREDMFDAHSYNKGGRVLHMLRKYVGDEAFFRALNLYLNRYQFTSVEVHNLRMAFEEVTGQDLNWFFNQWYLSPGHPRLAVKQEFANGQLTLQIRQKQDSVKYPTYRLPLHIDIYDRSGKSTRQSIWVENTSETFTFPMSEEPMLVQVDPEGSLLGTIEHERTTAQHIFQLRHNPRVLPRLEALKALNKEAPRGEVLMAYSRALDDKFWAVRQVAIKRIREADSSTRQTYMERFSRMALNDPKSLVRAEALEALAKYPYPAVAKTVEQGIMDKSPAASAAALQVYLDSPAPDKDKRIASFDLKENFDALGVVAAYYARSSDPSHLAWFEKQLDSNPDGRSIIISSYGQYLMKLPEGQRRAGIDRLARYAEKEPSMMTRFTSFQALAMHSETPGVKEKLRHIYEKESNDMLKKYYKMIADFK